MLDSKTKADIHADPLYYALVSIDLPSGREAAYVLGIGGLYDSACKADDADKQEAWANYHEALSALKRLTADRDRWRTLAKQAVDFAESK